MLNIPDTRLANQRISQTDLKTPADVVAWLGAIQGQDYTGALWSVGLRLPHATDKLIEQALIEKTLVRTWIMRGTLHLVAGKDIRWLVGLVGPKIIKSNATRYRELELELDTLTRSTDILARALSDDQQHNRPALLALLEQNGISTKGQRAAYMLQHAAYTGLICQGTTTLNHPTYMALDEVFPASSFSREEAITELMRRYFVSRGPATLQDFVHWSGLLISEARAALENVKSLLVEDTIDGQSYWRPASTPDVSKTAPSLYLLPGFDEYLLGYRDRSAVLDPQYAELVCPGKNGVFMPTIVSHGHMVGLWKRTFKKGAIHITAQPFTTLKDAEYEAFAAAAETYGQFLGMPVVLPEHS
jgi:hypothetical protein